jgi:hypothetical protein
LSRIGSSGLSPSDGSFFSSDVVIIATRTSKALWISRPQCTGTGVQQFRGGFDDYCAGATTVVVVVEAGTVAGVTVVVRLTVVVFSVGGGVLTTSSLAQAPRQAATPLMKIRRDNVFIFS